MNIQVLLKKKTGNTFDTIDISNYVNKIDTTIPSINLQKGNLITPSIKLTINNSGFHTIQDWILPNDFVFVEVIQDGITKFIGFVDTGYKNSFEKGKFETNLDVSHIFDTLKKEKITVSTTKNSLKDAIDYVIQQSKLKDIINTSLLPNITGNIQIVDVNETISNILQKIAMRYGVFLYWDGYYLKAYNFVWDNLNPSTTITKFKSIKKEKINNDIKQVIVKYSTYANTDNNYVLWFSTYKQVENAISECYIVVNGGQYVFGNEFEVELDKSIKYVDINNLKVFIQFNNSGGFYASSNTDIILENISYDVQKNKVYLKLKLKDNIPVAFITKLQLRGSALRIDKENVIISNVDLSKEKDFIVETYGSENQQDIQNLTDKIAFLLKRYKFKIDVETYNDVDIEIGSIVGLLDTTTNTNITVFCLSKRIQDTGFSYEFIPIENYIPSQINNNYSIPNQANEPYQTPSEIQQQAVETTLSILSSNEGTNQGGWTNIPSDFTSQDITVSTQFSFVSIRVKKQDNLINFLAYEIQYRIAGTTNWSPSEPLRFYTESINFKLDFQTDSNGNKIETTYDIRIRRITRNNITSNWFVFQATINPNASNEILVDILSIDDNNYWYSGAFRVGNPTNYILFQNDNLTIANASTQIANNGIIIENGSERTELYSNYIKTTGFLEMARGLKYNNEYYKFHRFNLNHNRTDTINLNGLTNPSKVYYEIFIPFYNIYLQGMKYNNVNYIVYNGNPFTLISELGGTLKIKMDSIVQYITNPNWGANNYIEIFVNVWANSEPNISITTDSNSYYSMNTNMFYITNGNYTLNLTSMANPKTIFIPYYSNATINYLFNSLSMNENIYFRKFYFSKSLSSWIFENFIWDIPNNDDNKSGKWEMEIQGRFYKTGHGNIYIQGGGYMYNAGGWIDGNNNWNNSSGTTGGAFVYDSNELYTISTIEVSNINGWGGMKVVRTGEGWNKYSNNFYIYGSHSFNRLSTAWSGANGTGNFIYISVRKTG